MLTDHSLEAWKIYLKASAISKYAAFLSTTFQEAIFQYSKSLSGQSKQQTRAQVMVKQVDGMLGFALGQVYTKHHFNEDALSIATRKFEFETISIFYIWCFQFAHC